MWLTNNRFVLKRFLNVFTFLLVSYCQSVVKCVTVYSNINVKNSYKNRVIFFWEGGCHQQIIFNHKGGGV